MENECQTIYTPHYLPKSSGLVHLFSHLATRKINAFGYLDMMKEKKQTAFGMESSYPVLGPFDGFDEKESRRALQTFFRTSFRTHLTLASMADRKASIMLRLNSLLLSGGIIFYRNILGEGGISVLTLVLFLVTTLLSLVTAAMVSRPHYFVSKREEILPPRQAAHQLFFFNHFVRMTQKDYEEAFGILMRDTGLLYGNMARDLYHYGKTLASKYRLLRLSYNVFIFGFLLTLLSFLYTKLMGYPG